MKIVLVLSDPPLPFATAAARWYYVLLKGLQERGCSVTAYAPCATAALAEEAAKLFPSPVYDLRCFPYPQRGGWRSKWETFLAPYSYHFGPDLKADLARTLMEDDCVLHLETQWCGWLGLGHRTKSVVNVLNLYGVDLASRAPSSRWDGLRSQRVFSTEKKLLRSFPRLLTLSDELAGRLRRINPEANVQVIPFGFDASLYRFVPYAGETKRSPVIGLIGTFNWQPTYSAGVRLLTRLWPDIHHRFPDARLLIVGRHARSALAAYLPKESSNITIEENVPDTLPYFRQLDVMLYAPGVGTGVKVKVLEAFALGIPVVTNREGAEGIPAIDGTHVCLAEDDQGLIAACARLLAERSIGARQCLAARTLLERHCDTDHVLDRWQEVYAQIASNG